MRIYRRRCRRGSNTALSSVCWLCLCLWVWFFRVASIDRSFVRSNESYCVYHRIWPWILPCVPQIPYAESMICTYIHAYGRRVCRSAGCWMLEFCFVSCNSIPLPPSLPPMLPCRRDGWVAAIPVLASLLHLEKQRRRMNNQHSSSVVVKGSTRLDSTTQGTCVFDIPRPSPPPPATFNSINPLFFPLLSRPVPFSFVPFSFAYATRPGTPHPKPCEGANVPGRRWVAEGVYGCEA